MYWTIDESPNVQPDLDGVGMTLPGWSDRDEFSFNGEGSAGLEVDRAGDILKIIDLPTETVMFAVKRSRVFEFAERGTRIYKYSDFIGPLLVTIEGKEGAWPAVQLGLPKLVFEEHRDRALALFAAYDKEHARIVNMRA